MSRLTFVVALLCIGIASSVAEAAITCGTVAGSVASCIPYVQHRVQTPPPGCCSGLHSIDSAARTTPDRQTVCACLKFVAGNIPGADYAVINGLIVRCGITTVPYKFSPSLDCSRFGYYYYY